MKLPKKGVILESLVVVVGAAVLLGLTLSNKYQPLNINGTTYQLTVATTTSAQSKGLGGRNSLPTNQGMLFPFSGAAVRCFWMKNMQFPLDIIWLNAQKQVVYIQSDATPASYPETFCPDTPAQYVLELNAGQANASGLQAGQTLNF